MKTLVIINGVTGAIGTAALARFTREPDMVVYGLTRKALPFSVFVTRDQLPVRTLLCSIGDITDREACRAFIAAVPLSSFGRVVYIHAVGIYPFELDTAGRIAVSNDEDGDGIDDRVPKLSYDAFFAMTDTLAGSTVPTDAFIFGGVADKYHPAVHTSWWKTMERIRAAMRERAGADSTVAYRILNISSVICPHELLSRPYVFQKTDADPRFWLMPEEVVERVQTLITTAEHSPFLEEDLFHPSDYYHMDYFADNHFTERKMAELGITRS